ncbi:MAG: glycosyltransferase family 2 protein [Terriglobales bacterium]
MSLSISVAMCTFNGRRFLNAQLDSIAAQDRPPDELVVCDDGSSDGSVEIIREFALRSPFPTRLVVNQKNLGSTKNFEKAISLSQGEIVALADQDDVWYRHKLDTIEKAFLQSSEIVAAFSDADMVDDKSRLLKFHLWPTFCFDRAEQSQFAKGNAVGVLTIHPVVTGATMAFRKQFFEPMAPIPANEIHDSWISFLLGACGRIEPIAEPLMQYRLHQGQQIGTGSLTMRGRIAQIGRNGVSFYLREIDRFQQLYDRLEERKADFPYADGVQREVERKICHLEHRAWLPRMRIARIPRVLREALNGGYRRYSGGWRSLAIDLVVRR